MTTLVKVRSPRERPFTSQVIRPGDGEKPGWGVAMYYYTALCPAEVYPPADIAPRVVGVAYCNDGFWWVVE